MKKLFVSTAILILSTTAFAVTSEDHFQNTNEFLKAIEGKHSLKGSEGCEDIIIEYIFETDRFNYHVDRRTYGVRINEHDLHPATQGDDSHFTVTKNSITNNRNWLRRGIRGFYEKRTYKIVKDDQGNLISFNHKIIRKKRIFSKPEIYQELDCKL